MKTLAVLLTITVIFLVGCSSITYTNKDGTSVSSTRVFMAASNIEAHVGDAGLKIGASQPDLATIAAVLQYLATLQPTNPTPAPAPAGGAK